MRAKLSSTLIAATLAFLTACAQAVEVTAQSAAVFDAESGRVLWAKNADVPRFPASTTKVMTGLLLVEHCKPDEIITAPDDTETVTDSSVYLRPGEKLTAQEMLYALLLRSANDAAHAIAVHIAGSDLAFAKMMNERAKELGCTNTNFHNPHGLNDDLHKVSARDLGIIACAAMTYPRFREVARTRKHLLVRSINQEDRWLFTRNKYLAMDQTADGVKTGYTVPAGHCYVGSATRNGSRIITVVLKSADWKADNKALLDWAFRNHTRQLQAKAGEELGEAKVAGGAVGKVRGELGRDLGLLVPTQGFDGLRRQVRFDPNLTAPIAAGSVIGRVVFSDGNGWTQSLPVLAAGGVKRATLVQKAGTAGWYVVIVGTGLFACRYWVRRKARRRRRARSYGTIHIR